MRSFIPLVPIFLLISKRMGYDRIFGLSLVILAAQVGFASAITNPFTLGVAQGIAEVPLYSGAGFRLVFFLRLPEHHRLLRAVLRCQGA